MRDNVSILNRQERFMKGIFVSTQLGQLGVIFHT